MNNILISTEEIAALSERLKYEVHYIKKQFDEIYDIIDECNCDTTDDPDAVTDRKAAQEACDVFQRFIEFAQTVCTEYTECEETMCEMLGAIVL